MEHPKVLVADDSPLVLRMIEKMLTAAGFPVVTARDGLEAMEKAVAEDVCLVILDVMMPRMNGYQACRLLKSEPATKDLPVVILTSKDQAGDRFWGIETGADYYVTKDSEPHRLVELVKNICATSVRARPHKAEGDRSDVDILSRVNELLDRKLYEATILSEIGRVARSLSHFDATFTSVMELVARVVDFTLGAMAFVEGDELDVVLMHQRKAAPAVVEEAKARLLDSIRHHRPDRSFERVHARSFAPANGASGVEETVLGGFAAFPVATGDRLAGLLAVAGRNVSRIGRDTESFLAQVANQAYIVMENSRLVERLRNLSVRDGLTELFNHRHSIEVLAGEIERVGRYQHEGVSLLLLDIDYFKRVNDAHGHLAGDAVLRDVAHILRDCVRGVDSVGRYGGEEFVVILPHTPREDALLTAERIRQQIAEHRFGDGTLHITVSIGVASYPGSAAATPSDLIHEADKALYLAKQAGRDRVV